MIWRRIEDWDDAYANFPNIPRSERWPDSWAESAARYRDTRTTQGLAKLDIAVGGDEGERHRYDLFLPDGKGKGLVVFVHGGYWMRFDKSLWSHLAAGPVERGYAVAIPSYPLCPDVSIADITRHVGMAIEAAASAVSGPIFLTGHSAGGHLVTRMVSATTPLSQATQDRIVHTLSLSGVHDLRPLMRTTMNATLGVSEHIALSESPAMLNPLEGARVTCWVGGTERAEFIRQSELLANVWTGLGAVTALVVEPDRHHFDVIDGLAFADHPLVETLLTGA